ncbi:class F sortase [Streptantibioticus silvisoli]|uniref:Class F sortase n=1 Tax=Streptantibioticus silvisoli TaxID=2705255 RepID=A0ABT6VSC3_9ACTN|nr:class F sortase [Streptantibioticus silvisoli]MDI5961370.1 class F sortase [Streptantibioticus silvisoli]
MTDSALHAGHSRRTTVILLVLAVACVAAGVTAVLAGTGRSGTPPPQPSRAAAGRPSHAAGAPVPAPSAGRTAAPSASASAAGVTALPASRPTTLDIPAIGVHTALLDLGLNKDGSLQVPGKPLQAGWFHGSPTPGRPGPAVILGHVDSYATGPAVFYRLGAMKPHEQIRVTRADHITAVFTVDAVHSYDKKSFPTPDVYGNTPDPELRLITCSDWNARTRAYDGNTVVFAHLTR